MEKLWKSGELHVNKRFCAPVRSHRLILLFISILFLALCDYYDFQLLVADPEMIPGKSTNALKHAEWP